MSLIQIGSMPKATAQTQTNGTIDVRTIPPRERHPLIFQTIDQLAPGASLVLVNDHDPKPLYYQLMAEKPGVVRWTYLEQGPETWRVNIARRHDPAQTPIMQLLADEPELQPIVEQFDLDTCCGGHLTVPEAAAEHGLDAQPILAALRAATA